MHHRLWSVSVVSVLVVAIGACQGDSTQSSVAQPSAASATAPLSADHPLAFYGAVIDHADASLPELDALGYEVVMHIDDSVGQEAYSAEVTGSYAVTQSEPLAAVTLDFVVGNDPTTGNVIDAVDARTLGGDFAPAAYAVSASQQAITIALGQPVAQGYTLQTRVRYHGRFVQTQSADNFDRGGLIADAKNSDGRRILYQSDWPSYARTWLPLRDHPRDGAALAMQMTLPVAYTAFSNGALLWNKDNGDGSKTWQYAITQQIPTYTIQFAAYSDWQEGTVANPDGVDARYEAYSGDQASAPAIYANVGAAMDFYSQKLGPYQYASLRFLETPSGDMENTTSVDLSDNEIHTDPGSMGEVAFHELSHHWFGDTVRIATWNDFWLSEAFAVYMTGRFLDAKMPADEAARYRSNDVLRMAIGGEAQGTPPNQAPHALRPPDPEVDVMTIFDAITYYKGGFVLRMLEHLLGSAAFDAALSRWFTTHAFSAVTTADFAQALGAEFPDRAADLQAFFAQWVNGSYRPDMRLTWSAQSGQAQGGQVSVTIEQLQSYGPPGGFHFPLDLALSDEGGSHTLRQTVSVDSMNATFTIAVDFTVAKVIGDPDEWLLGAFACDANQACRDGYACRTSGYSLTQVAGTSAGSAVPLAVCAPKRLPPP